LGFYFKRINKDQISDRLTELAIIHNPHTDEPNKLINMLKQQQAQLDGRSYLQKERMDEQDVRNFRQVQRLMASNAEKRKQNVES